MAQVAQVALDGGGSSTLLNVDSEQLASYGSYLIGAKESLDTLLDSLNTQMSKVTAGWTDEDGVAFAGKFATFIAEAKNIGVDIENLGKFATSEASKYDEILANCITGMGE